MLVSKFWYEFTWKNSRRNRFVCRRVDAEKAQLSAESTMTNTTRHRMNLLSHNTAYTGVVNAHTRKAVNAATEHFG